MALAGRLGVDVNLPHDDLAVWAQLFGESNGRLIVEVAQDDAAQFESLLAGAPLMRLGSVSAGPVCRIAIAGQIHIDLEIDLLLRVLEAAVGGSRQVTQSLRKPRILILHVSGTNRDAEAARACELAGGAPEIVHINQLRAGEHMLDDYAMLVLPGGFSYGDALGAGARLALDLRVYLEDELQVFVAKDRVVLGICNGFQTLVKCGLLPGEATPRRRTTLTENRSGHFECRWVHLQVNKASPVRQLAALDDLIFCPVAHGEGNFQVLDDATLAQLERDNLVVFRYVDEIGAPVNGAYPANPNGSVNDIAGICNAHGNVVGLMPHPEDHILPIQNPLGRSDRLGLPIFSAMVECARQM